MLALVQTHTRGPEGLRLAERPEPSFEDGSVTIDVEAVGVSYPDFLQSSGSYQIVRPTPFVHGIEGSGIVRSAPAGCGFTAGDRVAFTSTTGSWQEVVVLPQRSVFALSDAVSMHAAAGLLLNYLTAHFAVVHRARGREGDHALIHGAAGGLGTALLHVCAAFGIETTAVVSDARKRRHALENRASTVVTTSSWLRDPRTALGGRSVDLVFDPVGGNRLGRSIGCLAQGGRVVVLGFTSGSIPTVDVDRLQSNAELLGAGWGEFVRQNPTYPSSQWESLAPLFARGTLLATEPTVLPLTDAGVALASFSDRSAVGKIVLDVRSARGLNSEDVGQPAGHAVDEQG
ncbi:hypothetical protein CH299_27860 [Rhodococcus sp. 14-2686-1-2]|nr:MULTISPECIES: NADPH:quinone oxidoreductase family protein [unclassified Rhodococcus (in: high G+C Gram-positive bacteria)]OZE93169.1 hypothetical protein CH301_27340 [Rhodococcus sp. 15-1189-1-1a]OZF08287.1 hypothetical protein CH299_27860 [Rhodococcus sp. 14-2686-1-2]